MRTIRPRDTLTVLIGAALLASFAPTAHAAAQDTTYTLVPARSSLTYTFTQAGGANQGRFNAYTVRFDPSAGRLRVLIDMRSFDTGDRQRNGILGGKDFFDVTQYPQASFIARRLTRTGTGYQAIGTLTLRGVSRTVIVPFTWRITDIGGHRVGLLSGKTTLQRLDFGIGQGQWHSTTWVGDAVTVRFALELVPVPVPVPVPVR